MPYLPFEMIPDPDDLDVCPCGTLDGLWDLEYEFNEGFTLTHRTCGKPLDPAGLSEILTFKQAVTLSEDRCPDFGGWHGDTQCDCGVPLIATAVIEP